MFEKISAIETRYIELEKRMTEPEVIQDKDLYSKLAKEMSDIQDLVLKFRDYKKLSKEKQELEELLAKKHEDEFVRLVEQELANLNHKIERNKLELENLLIGNDPQENKDAIIEIRAGTGGQEASLFAADLFRMYSKYITQKGFKMEVLNTSLTETRGFREIIFSVKGKGAYKRFKFESGVHRVQRIPVTEASGRIHTSTVTVAVLPEPQEIELEINPKDIRVDVFRSSGHGGQSVNTTDSAVRITHIPTGIVVSCQDERSQLKNKIRALRVLRARLLDRLKREQESKISNDRKSQIGSAERSEKIRTYNFPDRRVTDHRIGLTLHKLDSIMEGDLDEFIDALLVNEKSLTFNSSLSSEKYDTD
ncbi:MAG: peptide chain release factor 1 [Candidatus Omnitrophica bacterium]|nr:peptide chain release factor 1 [Candidatus Omnitrophota bacterium]